MDNYIEGRTSFRIYGMPERFKTAENVFEDTRYKHLVQKMDLAREMGVDDFTGERFEDLTIKEEGE